MYLLNSAFCLECSQCLSDAIQLQIPAASTPGHQTRGPGAAAAPWPQKLNGAPQSPHSTARSSSSPCWAPGFPKAGRLVQGHGLKTGGRVWQPSKAGLQKRKRNKTCSWCQQGNSCRGTRIWQHFALWEAQDFAWKNNTRGWGTGGCCQRLHPQRRCTSPTAWGAECTEKPAESIFPIVDALYLAA